MSAALPNPPTPEEVPVSLRDVSIGIAIGSASWLVRYFCSMEKASPGYIMRRTATAGLTSLLVGMATQSYFSNPGLGYAAAGMAGYASPEACDLLIAKIKAMKGRTPPKG
jgi:hypothetical protein